MSKTELSFGIIYVCVQWCYIIYVTYYEFQSKEQFETILVEIGAFLKIWPLYLYLANETCDKFHVIDFFVPYVLRNSLICILAIFVHFDILMPIGVATERTQSLPWLFWYCLIVYLTTMKRNQPAHD